LPHTVALTFDDGPNPDATRRVLELLARHGVAATFFVWGEQAQRHPEVVREVLDGGHSVQPHCWAHVSHWTLAPAAIRADIDAVSALLAQIGVPPATLWRPPYGQTLAGATRTIAAERGLELAGWTINPQDYAGNDARKMYAEVTGALAAEERSVLLLHDGHRESGRRKRRADATNTVELVAMLLEDDALAFARISAGVEACLTDEPPAGASVVP
jgi:peptidoglycan/xylan/chitin deacetylase (PgdA/CDA1 family)